MGDKSTDSGILDNVGQRDILIAIVGNAGVGKSSFINKAVAVDTLPIDRALKPDNEVQYVICSKPDLYQDRKVVFLDIPGFDSESNEQVIQNKLRNRLRVVISKRLKISGILYLHRMTEAEFPSASLMHLTSLVTLCKETGQGPDTVLLVLTTQALPPKPTRVQRKIQKQWNTIFPQGISQSMRFENSTDSAWEIIKSSATYSNDLDKQSDPTVSGTGLPSSDHMQPAAMGPKKLPKGLRRDFSGIVLVPLPFALAAVRSIGDLNQVQYPEGIAAPNPDLNTNAKNGKFRYDRDFLLQFMVICREKPITLPPLDTMGIERIDYPVTRRHQKHTRSSAQATPAQGTPGQDDSGGMPSGRSRDQRGKQRNVNTSTQRATTVHAAPPANLEPVGPPKVTGGRWDKLKVTENKLDRMAIQVDADSPEFVYRRATSLLNKLTMERFDSISDQLINLVNKSEKERDGGTVFMVIHLVFERATDGVTRPEMYARLCRKMMEQISNKVQDDGIKTPEGKSITGGQLFRKFLLDRCQEDFERGWVAKEATAAAATSKATEHETTKAANEKNKEGGGGEEAVLYSGGSYATQKARRKGHGLIKFMGELFKMQMITERIMHECVKKLLANVNSPEEEKIESLCQLLRTAGSLLDTQKARAHMDVYFQRMRELTKSSNVTPRMQSMLQDVIELRERGWVVVNESGTNEAPKAQPQRKRLVLLPRTKPIEPTKTQEEESGKLPYQKHQRE